MSGSDFAKRQLQKHGWKEGAGLGKNEDGRSAPVKVSLKMDKSGVGHDPGKEFTDHWWLRVFNETAKQIGQSNNDSSPTSEAKARQKKMAAEKKHFYKGFVKSSTLSNGVELKDKPLDSSSEDETENKLKTSVPSLEDIHKFCGGATGHKAARFGIKMKGKLSRVASYDQKFEEKQKESQQLPRVTTAFSQDPSPNCNSETQDLQSSHANITTEGCKKKKKKQKKERKVDSSEYKHVDQVSSGENVGQSHEENNITELFSDCSSKKKKKKNKDQKAAKDSSICEDVWNRADGDEQRRGCSESGKKKKKKETITITYNSEQISDSREKKKKKEENFGR